MQYFEKLSGDGKTLTLSFSKYCYLAYLFRFATRFRCHLNLTMSLGIFDLFNLFLRRYLIIICFRRFLLKCGFWFSCKNKLFSKSAWVVLADILLKLSNLNWSLSYCLKLRYIDFFGSNFSNFVLRIVYIIWWWSLKPVSKEFVFINENFEFVISKSMHEPPSPLKHVFCFIIL